MKEHADAFGDYFSFKDIERDISAPVI